MFSDIRLAVRQILKSPGYSIVVVLTLALGLAVNSTIFGMISSFFLRPLPVPDPKNVVLVVQRSAAWKQPHQISFPDFQDYREGLKSIRGLYGYLLNPANLSPEGKSPERAWFEIVTPNAFETLGLRARLGRTLLPSDGEKPGGAAVTMLSYDCWKNRFGSDPAVIGKTIRINGHPFTVVGVGEPTFHGFSSMLQMAGFVPTSTIGLMRDQGMESLTWRGVPTWRVGGRLTAGATLSQASAEAAVLTHHLIEAYPEQHHGVSSLVLPEYLARPDPLFADYLPVLTALFVGLVGMVLIIACANVANLMFARAALRQHELSIRAALGASRGRLIRQLLVESLVLAAVAGVVSWFFSSSAGPLFLRFVPAGDLPILIDDSTRWIDYAFTVVMALVVGVASGLFPALRASRVDVIESLKSAAGGRVIATGHWARNVLVLGQVALSVVILASAALFLSSLHRVQTLDIGFRADHLLSASFDLKLQGYDQDGAKVFHQQILEKLRGTPGVEGAALTTHVPFGYNSGSRSVHPEVAPPTMQDGTTSVGFANISPGFFETMGLRLRTGRSIAEEDTGETRKVAVINRAMGELCWPGQDSIGKRFQPWKDGPWLEVVGVAETAKYIMLSEEPRPFYYAPLAQEFSAPLALMLRTAGRPATFAAVVRNAVHEIDPHLPIYDVREMDELMGTSIFAYMPMRMGATLAGIQGIIGVLLAVMGLFAVVSIGVNQRVPEIGIRMAMGAQSSNIVQAMLRQGVKLTLIGLVIGVVLALGVGLVLSKVVYGLAAIEPIAIGAVAVLLFFTATLACYIPARRATKVDPVAALRAS